MFVADECKELSIIRPVIQQGAYVDQQTNALNICVSLCVYTFFCNDKVSYLNLKPV